MLNWLHTNIPHDILFNFGLVQIHWYGLIMLVAILAGLFVILHLAPKFGIQKDDIWDLSFWLVIFGIIGARVYEVLVVDFAYYWQNPLAVFKVWQGGLAIHGSWIFGLLVIYVFSKRKKINLWRLLDITVVGVALGQAIGRWGNYFNQELFGLPTNLPWGIPIIPNLRPERFIINQYFHPAFLYESLGNLVIFGILYFFLRKKIFSGVIFWWYLILYSILRLSLEFIRLDPTLMIFGWRFPIIFSFLVMVMGIFGLLYTTRKH